MRRCFRSMRSTSLLVLAAAALLGASGPASAADFVVRPGGQSKVVFVSQAAMGFDHRSPGSCKVATLQRRGKFLCPEVFCYDMAATPRNRFRQVASE